MPYELLPITFAGAATIDNPPLALCTVLIVDAGGTFTLYAAPILNEDIMLCV